MSFKFLAQYSLILILTKNKIISSYLCKQKFVYGQLRFIDFKVFTLRCRINYKSEWYQQASWAHTQS